jgi:hypothetical protein
MPLAAAYRESSRLVGQAERENAPLGKSFDIEPDKKSEKENIRKISLGVLDRIIEVM